MDVEGDSAPEGLESREPTVEDLRDLCRELNARGAEYLVVGGFAMRAVGYDRRTMDVDLLIATSLENEARVLEALRCLPDGVAEQVAPGEVARFAVVRVADEIVVDLMRAACGIEFEEARTEVSAREIDGVSIPFASPRLLWRMKRNTRREKDAPDLLFLRHYFAQRGESPPD
jgi:hypothetical protein